MGKGYLAGAKIDASADKSAQTGAVMWGAIGALMNNVSTKSVERVKLSDSNLFSGSRRRKKCGADFGEHSFAGTGWSRE